VALVPSFLALVQPLAWTMRAPSFQSFLTLLTGWVFAPRRTVSAMLVASGVAGTRHHAAYYRVFSAASWSLDQLGLIVFRLLLPLLDAHLPVKLTLDDTHTRKRGLKMFGAGMHHDPLLSTRKKAVVTWGHSWVVLAVVVRLRSCPDRVFSLPIFFRLYLNHAAAQRARRTYRTRPELAVELFHLLCNAHPERRFQTLVDSSYAGETVLGHVPPTCDQTSRLPLKARLHEAPPTRKPGTTGRPRKRGERLPSPAQMLQQRARRVVLTIYGRKDHVRLVETVAYWYGVPHRPLKIVVVEPLRGGRPIQAFYTTRIDQAAEQVLTEYSERWSIEEAFQGGKSHLGFAEPQAWSRLSVLRTAPIAMLLYSLILLWFERIGHTAYCPPVRPWYRTKTRPSFADMLATLKRESLREVVSAKLGDAQPSQNLLDLLFAAANVAA
jgi:hypothetical protein